MKPETPTKIELKMRIAELEKAQYVPGLFRCAKCNCHLIASNLNENSGNISANNDPQKCPNKCGPMWKVTWKENSDAMTENCEKFSDIVKKLEAKLEGQVPSRSEK